VPHGGKPPEIREFSKADALFSCGIPLASLMLVVLATR
jgi:hypothetical protein